MSIFDKVGRLAKRAGNVVQDTARELVEDALMSDEGRKAFARAEAAIAHGDWDHALSELDKVEAAKPGLMRTSLLRGIAWLEQGRETRAIHFLEKAISTRESIEGYYFLGLGYERAERLPDARNALLAAAQQERDPTLAFDILFALGRVYLAMGRADRAVRDLERALQARPGDTDVVTLLAAALRREGNERAAIELLEEHQSQFTGATSWVLLGQLHQHESQFEAARDAFDRALEVEERSDALEGAAVVAFALGAPDRAGELAQRAVYKGGDSGRLRALQGQLHLLAGDYDLAVEHFDGALQLAPAQIDALVGLGDAALAGGDAPRAVGAYERALAQESEHHAALVGAGLARMAMGDRAAALRLLDQAMSIAPSSHVFAALGLLANDAQDPFEAIVFLEQALELANQEVSESNHPLASLMPADKIRAHLEQVRTSLQSPLELPASVVAGTQPLTSLLPTDLAPCVLSLRDHAASMPITRDAVGPLSAVLDTLDAPLRVAILGEFNAGKSTLVNAWLGEEVVPTGVLPTTAHLNVIRYGPRRVAHVVTRDATTDRLHRAEVSWQELASAVAEAGESVDHLEYFYPHPVLRALHFVDTPGFNAAVAGHSEIASRMLTEADAVLWIVDSNQALSASQRGLLEAIPGAREAVIMVLNKVDHLDESEIEEVLTYLRKNVGDVVHSVLPLSALQAFEIRDAARRNEAPADSDALDAAHWPGFEAVIEDDILARSSLLKVLEANRRLGVIAGSTLEAATQNEKRLGLLASQMSEGAEALTRSRDQLLARQVLDVVDRFRDQRNTALSVVAREVADARRPSGGWLSPLALAPDDMVFVLALLEERVVRALENARADTLEGVRGPVEAALGTLEWIARALASDQAGAVFQRLTTFVTEERLLRTRLDEQVVGWHRARLQGRLDAANSNAVLAQRLSAEDADVSERQRILAGIVGDPADGLRDDLAAWVQEYFDAALRLCDNVRRDIERLQLQVRFAVLKPFGVVAELTHTKSTT